MKMIFLLSVCIFSIGMGQQDAELFTRACAALERSDFQEALQTYREIAHKTGTVWYNMARAALAEQSYSDALLYALRAQRYGDASVYNASVNFCQEQADCLGTSKGDMRGKLFCYGVWLNKIMQPFFWQLFFLLAWYFLWLFLFGVSRVSSIFYACIFIALFILAFPVTVGFMVDRRECLVTENACMIFNGPHPSLYKVGEMPKNTKLVILQERNGWYKISAGDIIGWVERDAVVEI